MNSISFNFDYQINKSDAASIEGHLLNCDKLFAPPLSSYVNIHEYSEKLFSKATNFEAWHNNQLAGLVSVYFNDFIGRVAYISNVSVEVRYQNNGVASGLLSRAMIYGTKLGFLCIRLEVYRGNFKAITLYKKLGFEEENPGNDKHIMIKYF